MIVKTKNNILSFVKKNKTNIIIFISIILLELVLLYIEDIKEFLTFNINAEDLNGMGNEYRLRFLKADWSFTSKYTSYSASRYKFLPISIIFAGSIFLEKKNKLIKYLIGKKESPNNILLKAKLKTAVIPVIQYWVMIGIIYMIKVAIGANNIRDLYIEMISSESILAKILTTEELTICFHHIIISITTYILALLGINLIEAFNKYKGSMILISILWFAHLIISLILKIFSIDIWTGQYSPGIYMGYNMYEGISIKFLTTPLYSTIGMFIGLYLYNKKKKDHY